MNRIVVGALGALLLVASGVFWWQGRASVARDPAPALSLAVQPSGLAEEPLPEADAGDLVGPELPEANEHTREERRFDRFDRDHDGRITRNELLAPRARDFRKLDLDGNNLLTFEEWAGTTLAKFTTADRNGDGWLSRPEYATTKPKPKKKPACACK